MIKTIMQEKNNFIATQVADIQQITPPYNTGKGAGNQGVRKSERNSNIELLRLLSMFMILALHANHQSLGEPKADVAMANPSLMFGREFIQQLCEIGVDVFVLISGWFGIHPKIKSFGNFVFQVLFYSIGLFAVMYALGDRLPALKSLQLLWFGSGYWFVPAYIFLYILSPVLNSFVDTCDRGTFKKLLIVFFSLEMIYGWAFDDFANIDGGYSTLSFIGLYLLARYLRIYKPAITRMSAMRMFLIYIFIGLLGASITLASLLCGVSFLAEHIFGKMHIYTSPMVIISAVLVLLMFNKLNIQSKIINWFANSAFAIYLVHQHWMIRPYFCKGCANIFYSYNGLEYIGLIIGYLLLVGLTCLLLDKVRIACWKIICKVV